MPLGLRCLLELNYLWEKLEVGVKKAANDNSAFEMVKGVGGLGVTFKEHIGQERTIDVVNEAHDVTFKGDIGQIVNAIIREGNFDAPQGHRLETPKERKKCGLKLKATLKKEGRENPPNKGKSWGKR
ncbi:hypothetical protein RJT34_30115 [Clitoria ternatea]|uniref:Uncharacterized protein n=1 Tax=Clitoria ternatea TaxID=43366 RepID=A0AAN9I716_CLITE